MSGKPEAPRERLSSSARRAVIFDVATEVFAAQGYDRASMREIAKAATVTTPILYDHFGSKVDLYLQVVQQHAAKLIASWSRTPTGATTPEELFVQANTTFFTWIKENEMSWRTLFLDQPRAAEAVEINRQVRSMAEQAMAGMIAGLPGLRLPDSVGHDMAVAALAVQVTGAGNALAAWWWDNRSVSVESLVELNRALVWRGLGSTLP